MTITGWKTWFGRAVLIGVPPLLLLVSAELACRALGWGYPTSFLVADRVEGKDVWRTNEFYGYRFFQPLMARSPAPILIAREKTLGVKRIAVLGESAAMGDPLIEFSLARTLDKTLNAPGQPQRYEVINAGVTAISSPVVVDIARDLARAGVDIFVVYTGNNEIVGPYGPATVFQSSALGAWFTRLHVLWTRTRLASAIQVWQSSASPGKPWDGMAMFAENRITATDPRLPQVYNSYEKNLERIAELAQRRGIEAIFCTMAVNLRDCPPFGSAHGRKLTPEESQAWQDAVSAGKAALGAANLADAEKNFDAAMKIDPDHAELNYLVGGLAEKSGDSDVAARHYSRARDLDALRVRTDSRINAIIREVVARRGLALVESEQVLGAAPGADSFVDHVHFNVYGVALLADAVATVITERNAAKHAKTDPATIAARMGYDDWFERKLASIMLQRLQHPPFRDQTGNSERIAVWQEHQQSAQSALAEEPTEVILDRLERDQDAYPWDNEYAVQTMHRLAGIGAWSQAASVADEIRPNLLGTSAVSGLVALVYAKAGRTEDAAGVLVSSGPPYGYFLVDAAFQLLGTLEEMGDRQTARAVAERILTGAPAFPGRLALLRWRQETDK